MNQEVMKLYQEHGINPLGGCLPMLPQLPILYGFYESLEAPFAFRHAPWILWIKDLSQPDPSHIMGLPIPILPVIMIISMFIMQKMTPMMMTDPNQKRMMYIMLWCSVSCSSSFQAVWFFTSWRRILSASGSSFSSTALSRRSSRRWDRQRPLRQKHSGLSV